MIAHNVKVFPSNRPLAKEDQLAWKIAATATDKVKPSETVIDMVINRIIDNSAVALAAVLDACFDAKGKTIGVVVSGGNVDAAVFKTALDRAAGVRWPESRP